MIKVDITREIKRYKGVEKLSVQTTFSTSAITQISGPSGVGKTTLLRIIAGLLLPERGLIIANGATWLDTDQGVNMSVQSRKVGFVFQDYALFPNMTVRQHLNYGTTDSKWIDRLLSLGRMDTFSDQKPKELSGGQQQRLALLRALSTKPSLMLMDEPFSALDRSLKSALLPELKSLFLEMEITALIVTHYPTELENIADYTLEI